MSIETTTETHRAAGVTPAAPWRVSAVSVLHGYRLAVTFRDGMRGTVDMSALIGSPDAGIFLPLKDPALFQQVRVELGVLTWPNGADLDPAWMHEEIRKNGEWRLE